jgi:ABC-type uncharacterized transport system involved in gliding motility auxiliary subunit
MRVTRKSRLQVRAQNILFVVLFIGLVVLIGWVSTRYVWHADWTYGNRNSLTAASRKLVKTLTGPVQMTVFAGKNQALRQPVKELIAKYRRYDQDIHLAFVNPEVEPQRTRDLGITREGELVINYQGRTEKVESPSETAVTNALERVARSSARSVVFLTGNGERNPSGNANFDLGEFGKQLKQKGFKLRTVNLAQTPSIPDNTAVLVIAGPQARLLPGEVKIIRKYVKQGGNLLWLGDPGARHGLKPLAKALGVSFARGTLVDPNSRLLGLTDPTIVLVARYDSSSAITQNFNVATLFPQTTALNYKSHDDWQEDAFLKSLPRSWLETGKLAGAVKFNPKQGDRKGPLTIGLTLTRTVKSPQTAAKGGKNKLKAKPAKPAKHSDDSDKKADNTKPKQQRVVVIGDGDFLSNSWLNASGNLNLGLNIFNWLSHQENYINVNIRKAPDLTLTLSSLESGLISIGFLFGLPALLLCSGFTVWLRRRRR